MRGQIKEVLTGLSKATVIVTHDQLEALTMASRIAIMKDGSFHKDWKGERKAAQVGLSLRQLRHRFSVELGLSPRDYLRWRRLRRALVAIERGHSRPGAAPVQLPVGLDQGAGASDEMNRLRAALEAGGTPFGGWCTFTEPFVAEILAADGDNIAMQQSADGGFLVLGEEPMLFHCGPRALASRVKGSRA